MLRLLPLCILGGVLATLTLQAEGGPRANEFVLDVDLTVAPGVNEVVRSTLTMEAARIWSRQDVQLRWHPSGGEGRPNRAPLRALVIAAAPTSTRHPGWTVAELFRLSDFRAMAIASIPGAQRVLDESRARSPSSVVQHEDYRLGLVLGRALAHEIGHFLLDTSVHSLRGLMRTGIDSREFADLRAAEAFLLDEGTSRLVRQRLTQLGERAAVSPDATSLPVQGQ